MANTGVRVAATTAKGKLRKIIDHSLSSSKGAICFSAQYADSCTETEHGIGDGVQWLGRLTSPQYSDNLSIYVLDAGLKLLQEKRADLFYLTLSDCMQRKYPPGSPESNEFMQKLDARLREFVAYGASGFFVRVHLTGKADDVDEIVLFCRSLHQVEAAYTGEEGADLLEMPPDRVGDLIVISKKNAVIGSRRDEHDLSQLQEFRLRSHGGLSEQKIPLIRSTPLSHGDRIGPETWRNFDVFDLALNW